MKMVKLKNTFLLGYISSKILVNNLLFEYEILFSITVALKNISDSKKNIPINISFIRSVF